MEFWPIVTPDEIEAAKTPNGGWTRMQLASWGIDWPPPSGWRKLLTARRLKRSSLPEARKRYTMKKAAPLRAKPVEQKKPSQAWLDREAEEETMHLWHEAGTYSFICEHCHKKGSRELKAMEGWRDARRATSCPHCEKRVIL